MSALYADTNSDAELRSLSDALRGAADALQQLSERQDTESITEVTQLRRIVGEFQSFLNDSYQLCLRYMHFS